MLLLQPFLIWWTVILGGLLPAAVIITSLAVIVHHLRNTTVNNNNNNNNRKTLVIMTVITLCFLISVLPSVAVFISSQFWRPESSRWIGIAFTISAFNGLTNPVLLITCGSKYKESFRKAFCCSGADATEKQLEMRDVM